jgi:uncharacterized protein YndB with AHSA1/START domain
MVFHKRGQMSIRFEVSELIPASTEIVYKAWLNSDQHALMTGGAGAHVSDKIGEPFEAWDGYIQGKNLELQPFKRILQAWRTSEFSDSEPDSLLEILFEPANGGTKVTIRHSELPAHGMQYKQGWVDSYFEPMKDYFNQLKP